MSGVAWITSHALFLLTIILLTSERVNKSFVLQYIIPIITITLAPLTYISGLVSLPYIFVVIVFSTLSFTRKSILFSAVFLNLIIHTATYHHPSEHSCFSFSLSNISSFAMGLIGNQGLYSWNYSILSGFIGTTIALLSIIFIYRFLLASKSAWLPRLVVILYAISLSFCAGIARSDMGQNAFQTSKYANIGGIFWASLFIVLLTSIHFNKSWRRISSVILLIIAILSSSGFVFNYKEVIRFIDRRPFNERAMLAFQMNIKDWDSLRTAIYRNTNCDILRRKLVAIKHIPFSSRHKSPIPDHNTLECLLKYSSIRPDTGSLQSIQCIDKVHDAFRTVGWVSCSSGCPKIVHFDEHLNVIGYAIAGFKRPDLDKAYDDNILRIGFYGYIKTHSGRSTASVIVYPGGECVILPGISGIWTSIPRD
jgi:hypothetical protein